MNEWGYINHQGFEGRSETLDRESIKKNTEVQCVQHETRHIHLRFIHLECIGRFAATC